MRATAQAIRLVERVQGKNFIFQGELEDEADPPGASEDEDGGLL